MAGHTNIVLTVAALLGAAGVACAAGPVRFSDVGFDRGILPFTMDPGDGAGVAAADYDDDGDVDLFVPTARGVPHQLYRNDGTGDFEEIAADVGLGVTHGGRAALWFDADGDHRLDLVVATDCYQIISRACYAETTVRLYRQTAEGVFVDVTAAAGLLEDVVVTWGQHRAGISAGDLNGDGALDLVLGLWQGDARVLMNDGLGAFTDVAPATGIADAAYKHWQPVLHDFDGDDRLDVFWAVDQEPNRLWMNDGAGGFVDRAPAAGVDLSWTDMGVTLGDYDNDGDLDVYVTEITEFTNHNALFRNDSAGGTLLFEEVAIEAGVAYTGFGWGTTFFDADADGWLDLAVTNGWYSGVGYDDPSRFFRNLGPDADGRIAFEDRSSDAGFDDTFWGSALVAADLDRDGDLDLVQVTTQGGPVRVLETDRLGAAASHHWLVVRPRMAGSNHRAIGATVHVRAGGLEMMRPITAGTSHLGQEPAEAYFGLGGASIVDRVEVRWPDGRTSCFANVAVDGVLDVTDDGPPCPPPGDLDEDGVVCAPDLAALLAAWGPCGAAPCPADVDGNGTVGFADLSALLAAWGPCR